MKIHICYQFRNGPWGGGNQFLKALKSYFVESDVYTEDIKKADVIVLNSHQSFDEVLCTKYSYPGKVFIHRIDGPLIIVRGKKNRYDDMLIKFFNRKIADGIIFQSEWSRRECYKIGLKNVYDTVIINAPDKDFFNQEKKKEFKIEDKIKIVITSWSSNINKGFDIIRHLNNNLDFSKYEVTFVGNSPVRFKNIKMMGVVPHTEIPKILGSSDIFLFPSKLESCSNSLLEALHCGLPVVAYKGSSNVEVVGKAGELFNGREDVIEKIEKVAKNYSDYQRKILLPDIKEIGKKYYDFCLRIYADAKSMRYIPKHIRKNDFLILKCILLFWRNLNKLLWCVNRQLCIFESPIKKWSRIYYLVEKADWSIRWDGIYITTNVEKLLNVKSKIVTNCSGIRNQILHCGSRSLYVPHKWKDFHKSNKIIFTWFHGDKKDPNPDNLAMIEDLSRAIDICAFIHTTNARSKQRLVEWGIPADKIVVIPLGVDLCVFKPANQGAREKIRKKLGIPKGKVCIGSFQKDGVGWGPGNEPKLVKGPDVFCDAVIKLSKKYPVHVLLIGPARGYVKKRLTKAEVDFSHKYLKNFQDIAKYYHALDIYLVTSRNEGGPKAILESLASGIPLVTTDVGMARDVVNHSKNGYIAELENVNEIVRFASEILDNQEKTATIISNALKTIKAYSWENIARLYYRKMYSKLLKDRDAYFTV